MLFDTFGYWLFFAVVLLLIASVRAQTAKIVLVLASFVFYACWDVRFVLLLGASLLANWYFGLAIAARSGTSQRRVLIAAIAFNLVTLGFFKYCNFFIDTFAALAGLDAHAFALNVVLPVGISFFTFEGIAYAVDVYRGDLEARRSVLDFALFIAFFPHLIAGPIIRPMQFFPQTGQPLRLDADDARWGLREILKGLFKKLALSNYNAPLADAYFRHVPWNGADVPAWLGVLAFTLQIYFDFSGYTDIARGCARLLGYRFPANFERPYLAPSIAEFWRRWHISLSSWLRDYLYIPLGGNRRGEPRTYLNLMIVMGLGGLWHGASWNFAAWGLYHGALLALHRAWRHAVLQLGIGAAVDSAWLRPFWCVLTFCAVALGWVPFRAADFAATRATLHALLTTWPDVALVHAHAAIATIPLASLAFCWIDRERRLQDWLVARAPFAVAVGACVVLVLALELCAQVDAQIPFVYFQF